MTGAASGHLEDEEIPETPAGATDSPKSAASPESLEDEAR